jgi:hypothetical protein
MHWKLLDKKLVNKERGIIFADNAISLSFTPNNFLDSAFFIYSSKILPCVIDLDFPLKKVDTYSLSLVFVGGFKNVERFPSKSVRSNCRRALQYKLWVCKFSIRFSKIVVGKI